jgi:hypothetical protein
MLLALALLPLSPARAGETVSYKGRSIAVGDSRAAAQCLTLLRLGIDMVEGLPAKLRGLGGAVKTLRCDPPPTQSNTVVDNTVGVYVRDGGPGGRGFIDFRRNPAFLSGASYAMSLVSNGVYASEPHAAGGNQGAARQQQECRIMKVEFDTAKALDLDPRMVDGYGKRMMGRGC